MFPVAAAVTAVALLATRSDDFSQVLTSLGRLHSKPPLLASNDEGPQFSQEELTRAREMETSRADYDFSEGTCAFDQAISVENTYGDDAVGMVLQLPALFDQCKQLEKTPIGLKYAGIRLPIFILVSNKLEGTLSTNTSEGDTFQFLLDCVERESTDTKDLILLLENRKEKGPPSWDDEGRNDTIEAWYEQCKCHLRALLMMLDWAKAGEPLTTQKLLLCHNELMKGSHNSEGIPFELRYRCKNESVYAGQYVFPVDVNHEENMAAILEKANSKFGTQHPVEWSCDLLLEVLSSHPFLNGNGRMACMCYAYGLVRHGVPCAVVFSNWHSKSRSHYIEAVRRAQGQKGAANREGLYTMGTVGLFATLQNMCTFCETKIKSETNATLSDVDVCGSVAAIERCNCGHQDDVTTVTIKGSFSHHIEEVVESLVAVMTDGERRVWEAIVYHSFFAGASKDYQLWNQKFKKCSRQLERIALECSIPVGVKLLSPDEASITPRRS